MGFTFFAMGDPQINIPKWGTAGVETTIDRMNDLPGKPFPLGGTVDEPCGWSDLQRALQARSIRQGFATQS